MILGKSWKPGSLFTQFHDQIQEGLWQILRLQVDDYASLVAQIMHSIFLHINLMNWIENKTTGAGAVV